MYRKQILGPRAAAKQCNALSSVHIQSNVAATALGGPIQKVHSSLQLKWWNTSILTFIWHLFYTKRLHLICSKGPFGAFQIWQTFGNSRLFDTISTSRAEIYVKILLWLSLTGLSRFTARPEKSSFSWPKEPKYSYNNFVGFIAWHQKNCILNDDKNKSLLHRVGV